MKASKLAAITTSVFLGTSALAGAQTVDAPKVDSGWKMPVALPFDTQAVKADGEAAFSINHKACTLDKHLLTFSLGVSVPTKEAGGLDVTDTQIAALKEFYDMNLGATLNKMFTLAASTENANDLRSTGLESALMGRPSRDLGDKVSREDYAKVKAEMEKLGEDMNSQWSRFEAIMTATMGTFDEKAFPNGASIKLHASALPSPACK